MERRLSTSALQEQLETLKQQNAELARQNAEILDRLRNVEQQASVQKPAPLPPKPNGSLSSRVRNGYEQCKARYQAMLRQTLATADSYIPIQSAGKGMWYDPGQFGPYPIKAVTTEQLPRAVAAYITGEAEVRFNLSEARRREEGRAPNDTRCDYRPTIARLEVELETLIACTDDLVASTPLRLHPKFLSEKAHEGFTGIWSSPKQSR